MIPNRLSYKTLIGVKNTPNGPSIVIHRMTNNGYVIIGYYMEDNNESCF